jgi:hypothetical protein
MLSIRKSIPPKERHTGQASTTHSTEGDFLLVCVLYKGLIRCGAGSFPVISGIRRRRNFVRGLTLCHLDATLRRHEEAQQFLVGDIETALAERGVDVIAHKT